MIVSGLARLSKDSRIDCSFSLHIYGTLTEALAYRGVETVLKGILWTVILALLASTADRPASAMTVDTFRVDYAFSAFVINFSGSVEPDGLIQLADLADISFTSNVFVTSPPKADVTLFSFNTTGGASSLDFIVSDPAFPVLACGGASIALAAPCNAIGGVPIDATLMISTGLPIWSLDLPTITLRSSTTVPEPPTWAMLVAGLAGIALVRGARRGPGRKRSAAQAARAIAA